MVAEPMQEPDPGASVPPDSTPGRRSWLGALGFATFMAWVLTFGTWVTALAERTSSAYLDAAGFSCALIGFSLSMYWALKLADAGVQGAALVTAMTTTRAVATAWALLLAAGLLISVGALLGLVNLHGTERKVISDALSGLSALVGPATLVALASSGYGEYRRALEDIAKANE